MSALRCRSARVLAALAALSLRSGPLRAGDWLQRRELPGPPHRDRLSRDKFSRVLRDLGIAGPVRAARLQIATPDDGGLTAYASLIDNVTNDPSVLLAR